MANCLKIPNYESHPIRREKERWTRVRSRAPIDEKLTLYKYTIAKKKKTWCWNDRNIFHQIHKISLPSLSSCNDITLFFSFCFIVVSQWASSPSSWQRSTGRYRYRERYRLLARKTLAVNVVLRARSRRSDDARESRSFCGARTWPAIGRRARDRV